MTGAPEKPKKESKMHWETQIGAFRCIFLSMNSDAIPFPIHFPYPFPVCILYVLGVMPVHLRNVWQKWLQEEKHRLELISA